MTWEALAAIGISSLIYNAGMLLTGAYFLYVTRDKPMGNFKGALGRFATCTICAYGWPLICVVALIKWLTMGQKPPYKK